MHLDLRYPIGLLLTTYGVILAVQGAIVRATVLGLNVNLYWGLIMMTSGLVVLYLARRRSPSALDDRGAGAVRLDEGSGVDTDSDGGAGGTTRIGLHEWTPNEARNAVRVQSVLYDSQP